jgi:hypothetical protein
LNYNSVKETGCAVDLYSLRNVKSLAVTMVLSNNGKRIEECLETTINENL